MTTTTSTSAPASASASASSSSSLNPFKRRAQQKEGPSSSAKKSHRPRTMQQPRAPDRADTSQRSTPAPHTTTTTTTAAAAAPPATTTTPVPLPRRTPTPSPPPASPSSSSSSSSSSSDPITQAHSSLTALQTQLDHLSTHFDLNPSTLHFSPPSSSSSNTDPKLPFVPQNASYHSYIEDLTKLLLKLDGIDSNGDQGVRQRRKALVAAIERELERVETIKQGEWHRRQQLEQELSERRGKVDEMMRRFRRGEPATTSR